MRVPFPVPSLLLLTLVTSTVSLAASPLVIAHRGASGYLPEHTLEATALAHAQGADFLEQDVVLTRDGVPIVLHDLTLDATTDVATRFPRERARAEGYFAIDFTWAEIRTLRVHSRVDPATGQPVYPGRLPPGVGEFRVPSLAESLAWVAELNRRTGRVAGVYPEIKRPAFHAAEGQDIARIVWETLRSAGYDGEDDPVFVQSFDPDALRRLRHELNCPLPLIQLIGDNAWGEAAVDFDRMRTPDGLRAIADYAVGIGPWGNHLLTLGADGQPQPTTLVADAHAAGLLVHVYTLRADQLPPFAPAFEDVLRFAFEVARVDGAFTDFPDLAVRYRQRSAALRPTLTP